MGWSVQMTGALILATYGLPMDYLGRFQQVIGEHNDTRAA